MHNKRSYTGKDNDLPLVEAIDAADANLANGYTDASATFDTHLTITAVGQGDAGNAIGVAFVLGSGSTTTAVYDAETQTLTVTMASGGASHADIIAAIAASDAPLVATSAAPDPAADTIDAAIDRTALSGGND